MVAALRGGGPDIDLELKLLKDEERLYLQAAGPGTWYLTVLTKIKGSPQAALNALSCIYSQGRDMLLDRVRIATAMEGEKLEKMRIENEGERRKLFFDTLAKRQKIKSPEDRELVRQFLLSNMNSANPKIAGPIIAGLLPPPEPKTP